MFSGCTGLTIAPELPAISLVPDGRNYYVGMFRDCKQLHYVKMMAINVPSYSSFDEWLYHIADTGTFVKNAAANWDESKVIPSGWTVETATE